MVKTLVDKDSTVETALKFAAACFSEAEKLDPGCKELCDEIGKSASDLAASIGAKTAGDLAAKSKSWSRRQIAKVENIHSKRARWHIARGIFALTGA